MANYGQANLVFKIDLVDAGALVDISNFVQSVNGVKLEKMVEQSDAFGDSWEESLQTGIRKLNPIEIEGFYDDTAAAAGPEGLNVGAVVHAVTRSLEITWGSTKKTSCEVWVTAYERVAQRGKLTRYKATLQPTGAVTEA